MASFGAGFNHTARGSMGIKKAQKEPVEAYSFPLLKLHEIVQCLSELSVDLTEADLQEPEKHKGELRLAFVKLVSLQ